MDKTIVKQTIYKYEQGIEIKENIRTIEELKNCVVYSGYINDYYCSKKNKDAWLFADTKNSELHNELWRKCKSSDEICKRNGITEHEIQASNFGRIRLYNPNDIKICPLYDRTNTDEQIKNEVFAKLNKSGVGYLIAKNPVDQTKFLLYDPASPQCFENYLYVYRLVADAWLDGYKYYKPIGQIHHITNDGYDNRPENLIILNTFEHNKIPRDGKKDENKSDYYPGKYDKK